MKNTVLAIAIGTAAFAVCDAIASRRRTEFWRRIAAESARRTEAARCETALSVCVPDHRASQEF